MNLFKDFADAIRRQLTDQGYDVDSVNDNDDAAVRLYHKISRYTIESGPRHVLKAAGFECPSQYILGLQKLEQTITAGDSLLPYRSKSVSSPTWRDGLLDSWGIHHLHLGSDLTNDGFIERTNELLFCRFDSICAYFIKIAAHRPEPWVKKELVEIIHLNWPETISASRLSGVSAISPELSDEDRRRLRAANITSLLDMEDETVYVDPGFGTTTAGTHIMDLRWADQMFTIAKAIENQISSDWHRIVQDAKRQGNHLRGTEALCLRKTVPGLYWDISDQESGYWFRQYVGD